MENTIKPQKRISQKIAEFMFTLYLITLYIFVDKAETVIISKAVFVIYAVFAIIAVLRSKSIHIGKNVMIVYISFTWMFATVLWAKNTYDATVMMNTMWQLFVLFFLTYNLFAKQEDAHDTLLRALYIAGIVLLGYSLFIYGFDAVIKKMRTEDIVRLGKEINQENSFGMMNATTVIVAFYHFFYKKKYKLFHILMTALSFFFAMASGSRKAILMICMGVVFLVLKKYKTRHAYKGIMIGIILMILFVLVINLPLFDFINSRMEGLLNLMTGKGEVESSASLRWNMIEDGWNIFKERFLMGYGANNYQSVARYRTYAHNNFIEILVDFGILGFALYYAIYVMAFKNLWKAKSDGAKALFSIFFVSFIMEVAMVSYYSKIHWSMMAFFLISSSKNIEKKDTEETPPLAEVEADDTDASVKEKKIAEYKGRGI